VSLADAVARARARGAPPRDRPVGCVTIKYSPWSAQRKFHRDTHPFRLLVAGRQIGKTLACGVELLRIVMRAPAGSLGAVLAPTYKVAEAAIARLREIAMAIPGAAWREQKKRLDLPGGRAILVFSADRKESVRGQTIVALWIDEGAYLGAEAKNAAIGALMAVQGARVFVSTTPAGRNWVFEWWEEAEKGGSYARFRFRTADAPHHNAALLEDARRAMSAEFFAQEYEAAFIDALQLPFPDRSKLWVDGFDPRPKCASWMGIDLGKTRDWTVLTLMNVWGEAKVVDRFQKFAEWTEADERIIAALRATGAVAVIDTGGPGGAPGSVLASRLRKEKLPVVEVGTHVPGTKAKIVEQLASDIRWEVVHVERGQHSDQADHEMSKFQGLQRVIHGNKITVYEGPQVEGEHDDCVISLALANWGRSQDQGEPERSDLRKLMPPASRIPTGFGRGAPTKSRYMFRVAARSRQRSAVAWWHDRHERRAA
jgi:hypothetical protein